MRAVVSLIPMVLVLTAGTLHSQYQWSVFAGDPGLPSGFKDGTGKEARFKTPNGLALSQLDGNLYVADAGNNAIRKITPAGEVTTITGNPKRFNPVDGGWAEAGFSNIGCIAASGGGDLLVTQLVSSSAIRRIIPEGGVLTVKIPQSLFDLGFFGGLLSPARKKSSCHTPLGM